MNTQKRPTGRYPVRRSQPLPHAPNRKFPGPHTPGTSDRRQECAHCPHENTKKAPDQGKHVPEVGLEPDSSP
jgi:hypothetical protein